MSTGSKVCAIVVLYESERYVDACIGSLKRQDYPEMDVLVIDNASKDGGADLA